MKRPAVFFDRDNTLIACEGYLGDPAQVRIVPGAADAVARVRSLGFAVIVVSNQSGVARGMFSEADVHATNHRMDALLVAENSGAVIDRHEYCPYHPQGTVPEYAHESERRKPKPGMILEAARAMALDLERSWLIGDAARDIEAGIAAGVRTILFTDPTLTASPAAKENATVQADFTASTLVEAADLIARHLPQPDADADLLPPLAMKTSHPQPTAKLAIPLSAADASSAPGTDRELKSIHQTLDQVLREMRLQHEHKHNDFSVPKLLAGIVQVIALAALFFAYLHRDKPAVGSILLTAIFLQVLTMSLLLMGKSKS